LEIILDCINDQLIQLSKTKKNIYVYLFYKYESIDMLSKKLIIKGIKILKILLENIKICKNKIYKESLFNLISTFFQLYNSYELNLTEFKEVDNTINEIIIFFNNIFNNNTYIKNRNIRNTKDSINNIISTNNIDTFSSNSLYSNINSKIEINLKNNQITKSNNKISCHDNNYYSNNIIEFVFNSENNLNMIKSDFIKIIIEFIKVNNKTNINKKDLLISLKILRNVLEINKENKFIDNWDFEYYYNNLTTIMFNQKFLLSLNLNSIVIKIINSYKIYDKILIESFRLIVAMIYGGDISNQNKILIDNSETKTGNIFEHLAHYLMQIHQISFIKEFEIKHSFREDISDNNLIDQNYINLKNVYMIFKFLESLVKNHNKSFQLFMQKKYLAIQNMVYYNFLDISINYINSVIKIINPNILTLLDQIFDFLIESIQGPCIENQKVIINSNIIDLINDLFFEFTSDLEINIKGYYLSCNLNQTNIFIMKIIRLLLSLFEGNIEEKNIQSMYSNLDLLFLHNHIIQSFYKWISNKFKKYLNIIDPFFNSINGRQNEKSIQTNLKKDKNEKFKDLMFKLINIENIKIFDFDIQAMFEIYFFLKIILKKQTIKQFNVHAYFIFHFFEKFTGKVEIIFNKNLFKRYFIIHPCCFLLEKSLILKSLYKIDRTNHYTKINGLMNYSFRYFLQIEQIYWIRNKFNKIEFNYEFQSKLHKLCSFLSLSVNIYLIIILKKTVINNVVTEYKMEGLELVLFNSYLIVLAIFYIVKIVFYYFIIGKTKAYIKIVKLIHSLRTSSNIKYINENKNKLNCILSYYTYESIWETAKNILFVHKIEYKNEFINFCQGFIYYLKFLISDNVFKINIFYISLIICTIITKHYFLLSFILFDLIQYSFVIKSILKALVKNSEMIILTFLLMIFLNFIFAEIAYQHLNSDFFMPSINENTCASIFQCFITITNYGIRSTGSIGDVIQWISYSSSSHYFLRWIFDFSIWLLINLICINILLAIVVDAFSEIDEKRRFIENDINESCMICSIERNQLDTQTKGFFNHIFKVHPIEKITFFIYYLNNKKLTEMDGIESYIFNCILNNDISWFPIYQTMELIKERKINKK
jgi:hypothetical protein